MMEPVAIYSSAESANVWWFSILLAFPLAFLTITALCVWFQRRPPS